MEIEKKIKKITSQFYTERQFCNFCQKYAFALGAFLSSQQNIKQTLKVCWVSAAGRTTRFIAAIGRGRLDLFGAPSAENEASFATVEAR